MDEGLIQKVEDLILFADPGIAKEKYFLLCESKQVFIKLQKEHYVFFQLLLPLLNGEYSINEIKSKMSGEHSSIDTVRKSLDFLRKKGLLTDSTAKTCSKIELEMSSRKVMEINLDSYFERNLHLYRVLCRIILIITLCLPLLGGLLGYFRFSIINSCFQGANGFIWSQVEVWELAFVFTVFIISVFLHEIGHIISAVAMGVKPKSFTLLLKMGLMPIFYIRYANYYAISSFKKIIILLGGIWFNILQVFICWYLLNFLDDWKLAAILIYNLGMCISCFNLVSTSDGYYILTTIFNLEGLRWNMLKSIGSIIFKRDTCQHFFKSIKNYAYIVYFLISYGITFLSLYTLGIMIINFLKIGYINHNIISLLVFIFISINAFSMVKKFTASLKNVI